MTNEAHVTFFYISYLEEMTQRSGLCICGLIVGRMKKVS